MGELVAAPVAIDLSRLPAPNVVQATAYEDVLAALVADFTARCTAAGIAFDGFLESDPALKLLETAAYRIFLTLVALNDRARGVLLAFASGADLDNLAAFYGISRLTLAPATDTTPAVLESDADLRTRVTLAPEELSDIGRTAGAYRGIALRTAPSLKDVKPLKSEGGVINLVLLGRDGDGSVSADIVHQVQEALEPDDASQLTDIVTVRSATILPYSTTVIVQTRYGPDPAAVSAAVEASVRAYAADRHRIGQPVYRQMLEAAASVGSVERAIVDTADVVPGPDAAAWLETLTVQVVQG